MNRQEWESASIKEREDALEEVGFGMMARPKGTTNTLAERSWEELPRETKGMWGYHEVKGNETLAFRTNCIDGNDHKPTVGAVLDTCVKCGREIHETSDGSGYWFTDQDDRNWDVQFNGEVKANEVSLETMEQAKIWWDNKHPDRPWTDMRIGDRQRVILAFLRDPTTVLENYVKGTEDHVLVDDSGEELDWFNQYGNAYTDGNQTVIDTPNPQELDSVLKREGMRWNEDKQAYDWGVEAFKEDEHPRDAGGQFTSGGGSGGAGEKPKKEFTLAKYRRNEDKNYHDENALALVKQYGTPEEVKEIEDILKRNPEGYSGADGHADYQRRYEVSQKYWDNLLADDKARKAEKKKSKGEPKRKLIGNRQGKWYIDDPMKPEHRQNLINDVRERINRLQNDKDKEMAQKKIGKVEDMSDEQLSKFYMWMGGKPVYYESKATEQEDKCYDWEGNEVDCDTKEIIGAGYDKFTGLKANEDYIPAPYDQHFEWVASMDQDDYRCKHCGQWMYWDSPQGLNALHTAPEHKIIPIVRDHLATHGITEVKANESEWKVQTITHGDIPVTLGDKAEKIDAINAVKRMYFDEGFMDEKEILGAVKIGEARANEGVKYEFTIDDNNPNIDLDSVVMRYGGDWDGRKALIPNSNAYNFEEDLKKYADINYQITGVLDVPVDAQSQVIDAYHPDFRKEDWESLQPVIPYANEEFKEQEHPRDEGGQFTSGGGTSGGKHADKSDKDLVKAIKGGSKDWKDWERNEKTEELYAEIERRNKEIPSPKRPEGAKGTIFRDDPDAVKKMEAKVKYLEDIADYWKKIIKFPHRDYQNHDQLGDAKWYAMSNNSANLRDAKKKLAGIKAQQERGTQLVRKTTYKQDQYGKSKPRFYYSEEPKGEPPEEDWQKGGESYSDINKLLSEQYIDSDRKVSPSSFMGFTEPTDLPTGKNILDQPWGITEPEAPNGQDLTGKTIGQEDGDFERIRNLIESQELPETVEDVERWADSWGEDRELVKRVFEQEFGVYEGDEEIVEKKFIPPKIQYFKQYPYGIIQKNPFGESNTEGVRHAINLILEDNMSISHPELESKLSSWGYSSDEVKEGMSKYFGEAKANEERLSADTYYYDYSDYWKKGDTYVRSGLTLQAGVPTSWADKEWDELPTDVQAKIKDAGFVTSYENKDPHHIGWKNYGIDDYIEQAMKDYEEKRAEEDHEFSEMTDEELEELGKKESEPHVSDEGRWDDAPVEAPTEDWNTPAETLGKVQLDLLKGTDTPPEGVSLDAYAQGFDWQEGQETDDTSEYEVDVDEYIKTGEPIQKIEEQLEGDPTPWMSLGKMGFDTVKDIIFPANEEGSVDPDDPNYDPTLDDNKDEKALSKQDAEEGGKGSGKKGHQSWMRAIEEDHTYDFCENCNMITEQVNHKCDMCGKTLKV
ncbi:MAG: hypothetical protein V3V41_08050 [Candidatus Heimdallarchaeota archaeon]